MLAQFAEHRASETKVPKMVTKPVNFAPVWKARFSCSCLPKKHLCCSTLYKNEAGFLWEQCYTQYAFLKKRNEKSFRSFSYLELVPATAERMERVVALTL